MGPRRVLYCTRIIDLDGRLYIVYKGNHTMGMAVVFVGTFPRAVCLAKIGCPKNASSGGPETQLIFRSPDTCHIQTCSVFSMLEIVVTLFYKSFIRFDQRM